SPLLLDRFLVMVEFKGVKPLILITKKDLATEDEKETIKQYQQDYQQLGYKVVFLSLNETANFEKILTFFQEEVTVLMGQSGVGKSTLLNKIDPTLEIKTAEISTSLGRGRHTTRHVELINVNDGLVADTPGFSA